MPGLAVAAVWAPAEAVVRRMAVKASAQRMALELVPTRHFDPSLEETFRRGMQLARASTSMPWRVPRRATTVQIRLRAGHRGARVPAALVTYATISRSP